MSETDELIKKSQAGDTAAFGCLIDQQYQLIFRIAMKYAGRIEDAEDIAQLACIKLAKSISQFRFESQFSTWLYQLVLNCARDWRKAQKPADPDDLTELIDPVQSRAEQRVLLSQVLAHIDDMGDDFRETVVLVIGEGLSHGEAATVLGVKASTVSWRIHEIRNRLRKLMESEVSDD